MQSIQKLSRIVFGAGVLVAGGTFGHQAAAQVSERAPAACVAIATPADLDNMRNDLAGNYCLVNDIDMSGVANFVPIGDPSDGTFFVGTLDGKGHIIRNLTIVSDQQWVGLFADLEGTVENLSLQGANVRSTGDVAVAGVIAGQMQSGAVSGVHVSGGVSCHFCSAAGGLIGESNGGTTIQRSSAAVTVTLGGTSGHGGGLVGYSSGSISQSYATGAVSSVLDPDAGAGAGVTIGGLVGEAFGSISDSFAAGPVSVVVDPDQIGNIAGGLIGTASGAEIVRSFATGSVSVGAIPQYQNYSGGLIGWNNSATLREVYALGTVVNDSSGPSGGLVGQTTGSARFGYWNRQASGMATSAEGVGRTTAQLQANLPRGFKSDRWAITSGVSFPYLTAAGLNFAAPLAITVKNNLLYTFLPIGQLDPSQYAQAPAHADEASLAAAYTILARAIGQTDAVDALKNVAIDTYFWNDATQRRRWRGPVTAHAILGALTPLSAGTALDETNVIASLRARQVVLLRGRFRKDGGAGTHWMLATSFTTDADGNVAAIVADDPWTGLQVRIDPATKRVIAPARFPLAAFTVTAFQTVTLD